MQAGPTGRLLRRALRLGLPETGNSSIRWPTNVATCPGANTSKEDRCLGGLGHFVFQLRRPFAPGGNRRRLRQRHRQRHGQHRLRERRRRNIGSSVPLHDLRKRLPHPHHRPLQPERLTGPAQLFLRINDAVTEDRAGKSVEYLAMTPDGKKVYFTSAEQLNAKTGHQHRPLHVDEEEHHPRPLISKGDEPGAGEPRRLQRPVPQVRVKPISFNGIHLRPGGLGRQLPRGQLRSRPKNGDIYFLSPEQLDGSHGDPDQENLYDYRDGRFSTSPPSNPARSPASPTTEAEILQRHPVARMEVTPDGSQWPSSPPARSPNTTTPGTSRCTFTTLHPKGRLRLLHTRVAPRRHPT